MGIDCDALLDVRISDSDIFSLPPEVMALPERLDALYPELCRIFGPLESHDRRRWELDPYNILGDTDDERPELWVGGPFFVGCEILPEAVVLSHTSLWKYYLLDEQTRERVRQATELVASALGATRIVYMAELGLELLEEHGLLAGPFDPMLNCLATQWRPPSVWSPPYEIHENYWKTYFIESHPMRA